MRAKIYTPARNAMQSGQAKTGGWVFEYAPVAPKRTDPLMGWSGSKGAINQIRMNFDTKEAAIAYAQSKGVEYDVVESSSRTRKPIIRKMGYAENFVPDRRMPWTH